MDGPYTAIEGEAIAMSAAMSSDPDSDALTFSWSFGDGATGTGVDVSHTYTSGGTFTVRLIATGNVATAVNQLGAFVNELDALIRSGRLSAAEAAQLRALVTRIIAAAS